MKRFFVTAKQIMLATVLFAGLSFTACDDDDDEPEPEKPGTEQGGDNNQGGEEQKPGDEGDNNQGSEGDSNQGGDNTGGETTAVATKTITYQNQWGQIKWNAEADWKTITFEMEEKPSDVQIAVVSDLWTGSNPWDYLADYPQFEGATLVVDLVKIYEEKFEDKTTSETAEGYDANKGYNLTCTKINSVGIQNKKAGENTIKYKQVTVEKKDGSKVVLDLPTGQATDWKIAE